MDKKLKKQLNDMLSKKNVTGYSLQYMPKITDGVETEELCVRVYVTKKAKTSEEIKELSTRDFIPSTLNIGGSTIKTDVVEIGVLTAPPSGKLEPKIDPYNKTAINRPVTLGLSVGHWDVTAGSLGMLYEKRGQIYMGSNAHVLTPDPLLDPTEIIELRILQPGAYHGGQNNDNVVGEYFYHKKLGSSDLPSTCGVSQGVIKFLNWISEKLGRKSRFQAVEYEENHIDWALYKPLVPFRFEMADNSISTTTRKFVGHLWAGSESVGCICKARYCLQEGYNLHPDSPGIYEVKNTDIVMGSSFWCSYQTTVIDSSAVVQVQYSDTVITFTDAIIVENDGHIKGGCSGMGFFYVGR